MRGDTVSLSFSRSSFAIRSSPQVGFAWAITFQSGDADDYWLIVTTSNGSYRIWAEDLGDQPQPFFDVTGNQDQRRARIAQLLNGALLGRGIEIARRDDLLVAGFFVRSGN